LAAEPCYAVQTAEKPAVWRWIAEMAAPKETRRDPTHAAPQLRQLLDPGKGQGKAAELPMVQLKGRIIGGQQPGAALLEIDKRSYLLRQGSEIDIAGPHATANTIRVVEVTGDAVRVEIMPSGLTLTLN
jgi:uncharacterized protein (DUF2267 family)